jgi:hypothetical protein
MLEQLVVLAEVWVLESLQHAELALEAIQAIGRDVVKRLDRDEVSRFAIARFVDETNTTRAQWPEDLEAS